MQLWSINDPFSVLWRIFLSRSKTRRNSYAQFSPVGTQQSFLREGSAPRSNALSFYIPFLAQPFSYVPLTNGTPYTYLVYNLLSPFTAAKSTLLKWINPKPERFLNFFYSHKMPLLVLLGLFTDRNDRISYPFIYFNWWNPYLLQASDIWKDTHLAQGLPL